MSEIPNPAEEQNRAWEAGYQQGAAEVTAKVEALADEWEASGQIGHAIMLRARIGASSGLAEHASWGTDPSGYCGCEDCSAPDDVIPSRGDA